jgi:hypothetical protein
MGMVRDVPSMVEAVGARVTAHSNECLDVAESSMTDAQFREWLKRSNECVDSRLRRGVMDMFPCCISMLRATACENEVVSV